METPADSEDHRARYVVFVLEEGADIGSHQIVGPFHDYQLACSMASAICARYEFLSTMVTRLSPKRVKQWEHRRG